MRFILLIFFLLSAIIGIQSADPGSKELISTLKDLHSTLTRLVDKLGSHHKNGKSADAPSEPVTSNNAPNVVNGFSVKDQMTGGSTSNEPAPTSIDSDLQPPKPLGVGTGKRPFQCSPGYAGTFTHQIISPESGVDYTSNMIEARWSSELGWNPALILPVNNITLNPSAKVLNYGQQVYESIEATKAYDNRIFLFRPREHITRLKKAAERMALPDIDEEELLICLKRLVLSESTLIPSAYTNSSLEIRMLLMGISADQSISAGDDVLFYIYMIRHTPVSQLQYTQARSLYADPRFTRSWFGNVGRYKTSGNFASTFYVTQLAKGLGFNDVLWLNGKDEQMISLNEDNIFIFIINDRGRRELITPPDNGLLIPDVTRQTILEMTKHWNEFVVTERSMSINELRSIHRQGRLLEMFAANNFANVAPIVSIYYEPKRDIIRITTAGQRESLESRLNRAFRSIKYGLIDHPWGYTL